MKRSAQYFLIINDSFSVVFCNELWRQVKKPTFSDEALFFNYYCCFNFRCALNLPPNRAELTNQLAVAALGAGVITTLAVAQGQSPLTALGITLFSAIAAVAVGQVL